MKKEEVEDGKEKEKNKGKRREKMKKKFMCGRTRAFAACVYIQRIV